MMRGAQFDFFGSPAKKPAPFVGCPAPFADKGAHVCAAPGCGSREAWFGLGSIRGKPENLKFFCREHRP